MAIPPKAESLRNLSARDLADLVLKQREHYGEALMKVARLARKLNQHDIADVAIQLRDTYGVGEAKLEPFGRGNWRRGP